MRGVASTSPKERHHCPTPPHPMVSRNPAYTGKYDIKTAVPCSTASLSVRADKGPEGTTNNNKQQHQQTTTPTTTPTPTPPPPPTTTTATTTSI